MKQAIGLFLLGLVSIACSQSGTQGTDGGSLQDQGGSDQGPSGPGLSLVAGALGGTGNADDVGVAARFNGPSGLAFDGVGNALVADINGNTIRKIVLATGAVSTLAGSPGTVGSTDGTGAAARFGSPCAAAVDGAGNLLVAELNNNTIRKVVLATGAVTTLAGTAGMSGSTDGTGAAALFSAPCGVAVDGAGNLLVADSGNNTIRKVVLATGAVTTLAGTAGISGSTDSTGAAARFKSPWGMAVDGAGNLLVADLGNHTIRKVVLASGAVTTLAGTAGMSGSTDGTGAAALFKLPNALALDPAGNLLISDGLNFTIRKMVLATGAVTTLAGTAGMSGSTDGTGPAARFGNQGVSAGPEGVALDGAGNLLVADLGNSTIRKVVLATGAVTTLTGATSVYGATDGVGLAARFNGPTGLAVDGTGNVFISDLGNLTLRQLVLATGAVTTLAGSAGMLGTTDGTGAAALFAGPKGLAVDGAGNLFVADWRGHTIRKVVVATGVVTTLAGSGLAEGNSDGTGAAARFDFPLAATVDGAGNLYVADSINYIIRKVVLATGAVTTIAGMAGIAGSADGTGAAARFKFPGGVAQDGQGNLYVADTGSSTIRKVVVSSGAVTTLAGTAGVLGSADGTGAAASFRGPVGLALDSTGNLFVADVGNATIRKLQTATGAVTTVVGVPGKTGVKLGSLPARLNRPSFVAVSSTGALLITDENAVLMVK